MHNNLKLLITSKTDVLFLVFLVSYSVCFFYQVSLLLNPSIDGADYLLNARSWLTNDSLHSPYRPAFISWIIAGTWLITGESWLIIKYMFPLFTIATGIILYLLLRKTNGPVFAFGVTSLTLLNQIVFFWGMQILTESLSLFFLVLTLYFVKNNKESHWYLAGIAMGLTFASRYPILIQALSIVIVQSLITKRPKLISKAIIAFGSVAILVVMAIYIKNGTFSGAIQADTQFTILLTPYYLLHSIDIWSAIFILVPVAFFFKRTYKDKNNFTYIVWFFVSILFWSANATNHQERFMLQTTPAVYYLAILAIENITSMNILKDRFSRRKKLPQSDK